MSQRNEALQEVIDFLESGGGWENKSDVLGELFDRLDYSLPSDELVLQAYDTIIEKICNVLKSFQEPKEPNTNGKAIYRFYVDCGRHGELDGIFVLEKETFEKYRGLRLNFHDVLGKHSEVSIIIDDNYFSVVSDDPETIEFFEGHQLENGFNPFSYYYTEDLDDMLKEQEGEE